MQKVLGCFQERLAYSEEPMENITGEKEVRGVKRKMNLNTIALTRGKRHRKIHEHFHVRPTGIKIVGKEDDVQECKECHRRLPLTAFTTHTPRSDGAYYLRKICRECHTLVEAEHWIVTKNAPPKPDHCDCCGTKKILQGDHIHGTTIFRGWVCRNCNTGIGSLGDTLEGVLRAAVYLEKYKNKIIETLNKIKNEKT